MKECPRTQSGKHKGVEKEKVNTPYGEVYGPIVLCVWCGMVLDENDKRETS